MLLSFGFSLIWFNRGEIYTSVPLQYPPMVYLCLRLAWIAAARARAARRPGVAEQEPGPPARRRPVFGGSAPTWLLVTLLAVALALRFGLNAFDSNVIDVGYAGVIGADRITHGETPYGTFPGDCSTCDTYGPLNYIAYVPFELTQPWHGTWDSLPAAHGAATLFDLLCIGGLLMLGWQLSGLRLGIGLALAWSAFPFTAYALESNSNDSLVAAMLIWGLVVARHPLGRGLLLGLALATKFAPAVLVPLWSRWPYPRGGSWRQLIPYGAGLALAVALTGWVLLLDGLDGVRAFWSRTVGYQIERELAVLPVGPVPGPAAGPDRPDGGRGPGRRRGAPLAAAARPPHDERALGGAADRPRADRDPLVLPLHPLVPAVRPRRDGARLAAPRPGRRHRARARARAPARAAAGGRMTSARALPYLVVALAVFVWLVPLQHRLLRRRGDHRHPHLPGGLRSHRRRRHPLPRLLAGVPAPGRRALLAGRGAARASTRGAFSGLMLLALCATAVGVVALARALGLDQRRQALAGWRWPCRPLLVGNLVETRFDLALAAFLVWTIWAAVTERFGLMWALLAAAILLKLVPLALIPAFVIWQRHRAGTRRALAGAAGRLAVVVAVMAPFVILSPSGTWHLAHTTSTGRSSSSRPARPTCWGCTRWPTSP